jgi:hypothetical protein
MPPVLYRIPRGRKARRCQTCQAVMYWVIAPGGKSLPVDLVHHASTAPTKTTDGAGAAHWASCPAPHRRPNYASSTLTASH